MRNQSASTQAVKTKRDEERPKPSEGPLEAISTEQITELLHQQARRGDLRCRARVSTQGIAKEEEEMFQVIVEYVWVATGFKFMSVWFPG